MKQLLSVLVFLAAPLVAQAADDVTTPNPPVTSNASPKFIPLDRSGRPSIKPTPTLAAPKMRSDASSMNNGFMRIDRQMLAPASMQHSLIVSPQIVRPGVNANISGSDDPRIIRGSEPVTTASPLVTTPGYTGNDPVLSLYNGTTNERPSSFRDTLLGRGTPSNTYQTPANNVHHVWPIPASANQKISSSFGYRADPIDHHTEFHNGIDIAAAPGTPVLSAAAGQVETVGRDGLYGQSISILNADGSESKYGHLSAQNVSVGQRVRAGQPIGAVGATGRVTGPHLDYRVSQNGLTVDPMKMLTPPAAIPVDNSTTIHRGIAQNTTVPRPMLSAKQEKLIIVR